MKGSGSNRIILFDNLKAILILCVVVIHSVAPFNGGWGVVLGKSDVMIAIDTWMSGFAMHCFYMISGYFAAMSLGRYKSYENGLIRIKRLLVPALIGFVTYQFFSVWFIVASQKALPLGEALYHFEWKYYLFFGGWVGHLWFINNLLVYYVIMIVADKYKTLNYCVDFFVSKIKKIRYIRIVAFILVMFFIGKLYKEVVPYFYLFSFFTPPHLFKYIPFFVLGIILYRKNIVKRYAGLQLKYCVLILVGYTVFVVIEQWLRISNTEFNSVMKWAYEGVYSLWALILCFAVFSLANVIPRISTVMIISQSSFSIYLLHHPIILVACYVLKRYEVFSLWGAVVVFFVSLVTSIALRKYVLLRIPVLRYVIGER
ncbi:MAG: acyltransferase family protein [Fibrobacterales bacterium]